MNLREFTLGLTQLGYDGLKANVARNRTLSSNDEIRVEDAKSMIRYSSDDGAGDAWSIWFDEATKTALIVAFDHESALSFYPESDYYGQIAYFDAVPSQFHDFIYGLSEDEEQLLLPLITSEGSVLSATLVIVLEDKTVTVNEHYARDVAEKKEDGGIWLLKRLLMRDADIIGEMVTVHLIYNPDVVKTIFKVLEDRKIESDESDSSLKIVLAQLLDEILANE